MKVELTAARKRELRSLGRSLKPLLQLGKDGLTPAVIAKADELLGRRELIKVRALDNVPEPPEDLAAQLSRQTSSALVASVGRTFLLYRPAPEAAGDA